MGPSKRLHLVCISAFFSFMADDLTFSFNISLCVLQFYTNKIQKTVPKECNFVKSTSVLPGV